MAAPTFAAGAYEKIQPAIDDGTLAYPAYVYVSDLNMLAFIDKNQEIQLIQGNNSGSTSGVTFIELDTDEETTEDSETETETEETTE